MLNDDKIRLMNEIALFEKKERKRERPAEVFFRRDYVAKHMLQSFFAWTLSYGLLLGVVMLYILERILNTFTDKKLRDMIRLDFSVVSDVNYYNGIVFNGFIRGIPDCVISGGQYDRLMQKMKRRSGAIGFGVYMDRLERLLEETPEYDIEILLLYDETARITQLNDVIRGLTHEGHTVVAQRKIPDKLKFQRLMRLTDGEVTEIEADA